VSHPNGVGVISGVAPLAVFFDASSTTAGLAARPFHDLEFRWHFGEAALPNWTYGRPGANKNVAMGPLAAHVFETPGTYNVCVTVTDGTNLADGQIIINVEDPGSAPGSGHFANSTICASTSGNFSGCPVTCTAANCRTTADFDDMINGAAFGNRGNGTFKRILFRRGEIFTVSTAATLRGSGPGHIGAFGAGAAPVISSAGHVPIVVGHDTNLAFTDWRVTDLDFDGVDRANFGVFPNGPATRMTFLRNTFRRHNIGITLLPNGLNAINAGATLAPIWNQWAIVENEFNNTAQNGFLGAVVASAFLGNRVQTPDTEHAIRVTFSQKVVLSHNELFGSPVGVGAGASALQIRGVHIDPASPLRNTGENQFTIPANTFTEQVVVSDNKLIGGLPAQNGAGFLFGIRAVNADQTVWFRDIIVERNWMVAHNSTGLGAVMQVESTLTTIRNNLFDLHAILSGAPNGYRAVVLQRNGCNPTCTGLTTDNVSVFNNSVYNGRADAANPFVIVDLNNAANPVVVRNNIGFAPLNTDPQTGIVRNNGGGTFTATNNSPVIQDSPAFLTTPPVAPADWEPQAGSYAIGTGGLQGQPSAGRVPVFSDYFANCVPDCTSPRTGNHMGAVIP
jgi:hypothetical protein